MKLIGELLLNEFCYAFACIKLNSPNSYLAIVFVNGTLGALVDWPASYLRCGSDFYGFTESRSTTVLPYSERSDIFISEAWWSWTWNGSLLFLQLNEFEFQQASVWKNLSFELPGGLNIEIKLVLSILFCFVSGNFCPYFPLMGLSFVVYLNLPYLDWPLIVYLIFS